jgi:hypothetical protein
MSQKGNTLVVVVVSLAIISAFVTAFLYLQNQKLKGNIVVNPSPQVTFPRSTPENGEQAIENPNFPPAAVSPSPSTATCTPVIVYEMGSSIPEGDKTQIQAKVVNPFSDYYCDLEGQGFVVSLSIGNNTGASQDQYPYSAKAIFKNGAQAGFLLSKNNGVVDWWLPECLGPCPFSAEFKAKYPEIVAKSP